MTRAVRTGGFIIAPILIPSLFLVIWNIVAAQVGNDLILPGLNEVGTLLLHPRADVISMGSMVGNVIVSLVRVLVGYGLAVMVAIPLGLIMGASKKVYSLLNTFLGLFRPIPPLAWVPLVLAWFGVASFATLAGVEEGKWFIWLNNLKLSMLFIIFIGAFYPVLSNTIYGVSNVPKILVESSRVLGASKKDLFVKVLLPAAAPSIVTGMRVGLGVAWMCLVSAEMLPGSLSGVGYLITHAYTVARTDVVVAGMVSIGVVGALMDWGFRVVESRYFRWQRLSR
jgi:NitT/TauT family transport system permease protein